MLFSFFTLSRINAYNREHLRLPPLLMQVLKEP
jgi:hypothetical protein